MEVESLCRYLASREINITSNNKWLNECVSWFKSNPDLMVTYGSLQDYVTMQWLLADFKDIRNSCLPNVNDDRAADLPGKYAVQINWMRDIGQSCYSQYRSIQSKDATLNEDVTAEESKKQSWEPNPKRILMMEITDGVKTMRAMEYGAIPKLGVAFVPGMKILLKGPIECRRKILFLKNCNVDIFGGEVEELYEVNRMENVLSRCLNLPALRPSPTSVRDDPPSVSAQNQNSISSANPNINLQTNNSSVPSSLNTEFQTIASLPSRLQANGSVSSNTNLEVPTFSGFRNPPRSEFENVQINGNGEMDILEEDDDFLNQLPDEMLDMDCADGYETGTKRPTPVLDCVSDVSSKPPSPQPSPSVTFQVPSCNSSSSSQKSLKINKHKQFPSLEDFSIKRKVDLSLNRTVKVQSTLTNFVLPKTPVVTSTSTKAVGNSSKYFSPVTPSSQSSCTVISDSTRTSPFDSLQSPMVHSFVPTSTSTGLKNALTKSSRTEIEGQRQPWDDNSQSSFESNHTSNVSSRSGSDCKLVNGSNLGGDEDILEIIDITKSTYPVVRKQQCKINAILKVKVIDHKWTCNAEANIDGQSTKVQFSNKVLAEIFGIDAAKVEDLRKDFSKNPSIKQEINHILTVGQKKLKTLNCPMTVEYFADDCTPQITCINNNR